VDVSDASKFEMAMLNLQILKARRPVKFCTCGQL
jgi:hypothetical protein